MLNNNNNSTIIRTDRMKTIPVLADGFPQGKWKWNKLVSQLYDQLFQSQISSFPAECNHHPISSGSFLAPENPVAAESSCLSR